MYYMAKQFSEMGLEVLLIASDANHLANYPQTEKVYNEEQYGQLKYLWLKTYKYSKSASLKRFISWFDFERKLFRIDRSRYSRPDVVIISSLSLFSLLYGFYLKKIYRCKLIFEVRDIYPLTLTEEFGVSRWHPMVLLMGWIEKKGYRRADLIVGTMPNLEEHVHALTGLKKNVFYSPLGIDSIWQIKSNTNRDIDNLFPQDKFVVGYAGSMGISNALGPFIKAIKTVANNDDLYFILVGGGDLKRNYEAELAGLNNVTIGPLIDRADIPYFLSRCDLLYLAVHDSKVWRYGQSMNKLIDYMMAAKPVIASYNGYPSMLNEAESGKFVPTGDRDAIIKAIYSYKEMSRQEREEIGRRGRKWVLENHSYEKLARCYYERILDLIES